MLSVNVVRSAISDETNRPKINAQPMDTIKGKDDINFLPCKVFY